MIFVGIGGFITGIIFSLLITKHIEVGILHVDRVSDPTTDHYKFEITTDLNKLGTKKYVKMRVKESK